MRIFYSLLFGAVFGGLCWIVFFTTLAQIFLWLFSNAPRDRLAHFGKGLATYAGQLIRYLSFVTDDLPFPFSDWPDVPTQITPEDLKDL